MGGGLGDAGLERKADRNLVRLAGLHVSERFFSASCGVAGLLFAASVRWVCRRFADQRRESERSGVGVSGLNTSSAPSMSGEKCRL